MSKRCWAVNVDLGRCQLDGGHDGEHSVTHTWGDEDSYDPTSITVMTRTGGQDVPIVVVDNKTVAQATVEIPSHRRKCFTCHHDYAAHGDGPCADCDCLGFVD